MPTVTYLLLAILLTNVVITALLYRWMGQRADLKVGHAVGHAGLGNRQADKAAR